MWSGAVVLLVAVVAIVGSFDGPSSGSALGPVQPITPVQSFPAMVRGVEADLSRRGEAAGAANPGPWFSGGQGAFIGLDDALIDETFETDHVGVSGNGCVAAYVVKADSTVLTLTVEQPPFDSDLTRIGTIDRCNPANSRVLIDAKTGEGPFGQPVLDFDGSTVVVPMASRVVRFDIGATVVESQLPQTLPGFSPVVDENSYGFTGNSVDVSADGNVVVATLAQACVASACSPAAVIVGWEAGSATLQVLSSPTGTASGRSFSPSISGNGQFVSFVSTDRLAGQPTSQTGPWVYVRPRDTPTFTPVSPLDEQAYYSSISEDGTQVAFMRTRPGCDGTISVPGCVDDPDEIISVVFSSVPGLAGLRQTDDVNVAAGGVSGAHRSPVLSGNGRYVAWETTGGALLLGTPGFSDSFHVVMRQRDASLTVGSIAFGSVPAGTSSTRSTTVTNTGRSSILPSQIFTTAPQFVVAGGTCNGFAWIPPGATCTVDVRFDAPLVAGSSNAELVVREVGFQPLSASGRLTGTATLPPETEPTTTPPPTTTTPPPAPTVILSAVPNPLDFGPVAVGIPTTVLEVTIANSGNSAGPIQLFVTGAHASDFEVVSDSCRVAPLAAGATCGVRVRMRATAGGDRQATLDVISGAVSTQVLLVGQGRLAPQLAASPAAIAERGSTTIVGQGFIPGEAVAVEVRPTSLVLPVVADLGGVFQIPLSAFGRLPLGTYDLVVAARPDAYDEVRTTLLVALGTFQPQGPTSAVFGDNLLVARGN